MANKAFNSIDGFSVGQPANGVIDGNSNANLANANIVGNANLSGNLNVTGSANLTGNVSISNIANFSIPGGTAGQGIGTDGAGNLAWYTFGGGGGGGNPAPPANSVQFNNAGSFGGSATFNYNNVTSTLSVYAANLTGNIKAASANLGNLVSANYVNVAANVITSNLRILSDLNAITGNFYGNVNVQANLTANYFIGNGYYLTSVTAARLANNLSNVDIPSVNGPITMTSNGYANIFVASSSGVIVRPSLTVGTSNTAYTKTIVSGNGNPTLVLSDVTNLAKGMVLSGSPFNTTPRPIITSINAGASSVTISSPPSAGGLTSVTFTSYPVGNLNVNTINGNLGFRVTSGTYIDNIAVVNGTVANSAVHAIAIPTIGASNSNVTFSNAATFYIQGAPITVGPANITNAYSLYVNSGTSRFATEVQVGGNINVEASLNTVNANVTGIANIVSLDVTSLANLGDIANITITGGLPGYSILTDGAGSLVWGPGGGGSGGTPAGGNQAVQFNDRGNFGASGTFTFDSTTEVLSVPSLNVANGNITANSLSIIAGVQNATLSVGSSNITIGNNAPVTISTGGIPNVMSISTTNVTANATFSTTGSLIFQGEAQVVNAGLFTIGKSYQITTLGNTDWASAAGTTNIPAGSFTISDSYIISTVGDTDWVSIGATASAVVDGEITDGNNGQFIGEIYDNSVSTIISFSGDISDGAGGIGQILNVTTSPAPSTIVIGMQIAGYGVTSSTQITGQLTGTPGDIGTYSVDIPQFVPSATIQGASAGTNLYVAGVTTYGTTITVGTVLSGSGVVPNTTILAQVNGIPNGVGNYTVDTSQVIFSSTIDAISPGNVLTVTNVTSGALQVGTALTGTNIIPGTTITALGSGTGGVGNYTVSTSQLTPTTTVTGQPLPGANFVATGFGSGTGIADQYYVLGDSFVAVNAGSGTGVGVLNGNQDRGAVLSYWESNLGFPANAFMGWNQANLEFLIANQVTVSNGVITDYSEGNIRANYFIGNFTGNIYGPIAGPGQNTQIIYQNDQFMNGAVGFTYDNTTNSVYIANVLTVNGDIFGNGNINANGYLSIAQDADVGGNITVTGNIDGLGNIYSQFDASIGGNANIGNNLNLLGNLVTPGNISGNNFTAAGDVSVNGNITVDNLTLTGNFTTLGNVVALNGIFNNDVNILHDLSVTGNVNISGDVTLPFGNITANGMSTDGNNFTVNVLKDITFNSQNLYIQTTRTEISGYVNAYSSMNVASYLAVNGVIYSNSGIQASFNSPISTGGTISGGNLNIGANGSITNLTATLSTLSNSQPNITNVGALTNLAVVGNTTIGNVLAPNIILANTGEITVMGNVVGQVDGTPTGPTYYIGNGVYLSGITFTGSTGGRIENGGSNVSIFGPSTNIEMAVDLVNVVSISRNTMSLTGLSTYGNMDLIVSGNISAPSFVNGTSNLVIRNSGDVTISANGVANVIKATSNSVSLIGNTDITGNLLSTTGNFTAGGYGNFGGNILATGNANIFANARIGGSANIAGNLLVQSKTDITDNFTVGSFSNTGRPILGSNANISGNANIGGNLQVGWSTDYTLANTGRRDITLFGNVEGLRDGDPRGPTYYFGNAAFLEGIPPAPAGSYISNGSSNVYIVGPNANITMSANTVNLVTVFANVNSSGGVSNLGMILGGQRDAGPGGLPAAYTGPANLSLINNSSIYFTGYGNIELDTGYFVGPHANIQTLFANAGNILSLTTAAVNILDMSGAGFGYGDLSVAGNTTIGRRLEVTGSANVSGYFRTYAGANISGGLAVYGDLNLPYDNINVTRGTINSNNANITNNISIGGNATIGNYLTVDATSSLSGLGLAGIRGNLGNGNTYISTPTRSGNMYVYMGNIANVNENGTLAISLSAPPIPQVTTLASNAEYSTNVFTVVNSQVFNLDAPIEFTGSVFGNVTLGNIYYVKSQPSTTELTISATLRGPTFSVELTDTATATNGITDLIDVPNGLKFPIGSGVIFTGTVFGNVTANTTYYVWTNNSTQIKISEDPLSTSPSPLQLTTATGSMTVTNAIQSNITLATIGAPADYLTVAASEYLDAYNIGDAVQFSGTLFGGVSSGVTYYIVALTSVFVTNVPPYTNLSISTTPTGGAMTLTTGSGSMTMTRTGQGGVMTVRRQSSLDTSMLLQGKLDVTGYANLLGGVGLTGDVDVNGNLNVTNDLAVTGAITATSLNITSDLIVPGNITGGNLLTSGDVIATGDINGANGIFTGSVTAGSSLNVIGNVEATLGDFANLGNTVQGNYFVGNGFYLTGVVSSGPPYSRLENGSSNVAILFANGNATITVGGIANVLNVSTIGANIKGIANITGNLVVGGNANIRVNANIGGSVAIGGNANIIGNSNIGGNLDVTGNLSAANANLGYQANAQFFVGNGFYLTGIQASAGTSMVNGSSNVVTRYSGNTTLSVGGVPNVFLVANNGVFVTGNITGTANANISGNLNLTGNANILGNVTIPSSKILSVNNISNTYSVSNGTSNLRIAGSGAVTISSGGIANIATFGTTATSLTGNLNVLQNMAVTGNLSASNINGVQNFTLTGNMQTGNLIVLSDSTFGGTVTINGLFNVVGDTAITGNLSVSKNQVVVGNITAGVNAIIGGEARVTGNANITGNTNVTSSLFVGANANIVAGLRVGTNANILGNANVGGNLVVISNANVGGNLVVTSNANVGGNLVVTSNANVGGEFRVTGNANVTTNVNVTGNVTASYYFGNGSQLSGIQASGGTANNIANGTSNVNIPIASGNITMGAGGVANVFVVSTVGANVANLVVTGNTDLNGISNVKIAGGTSGQVVQTDGSGNLSFVSVSTSGVSNGTSNLSIPLIDGNVNISANGTANVFVVSGTGITVTGNSNLGNISNVFITGGAANQFLQTDGSGNLSFATVSSTSISNGNSSVSIPVADGNVDITANGNTTLVVTDTGANVTGTIGATSNITAGNGSAASYFDVNAINTSYAATRVIRSGSERWLIGADASSANGNAVIRYDATINYVTVDETGLVTLSNNLSVVGNANVGNLTTVGNVDSGNANLGNLVLANYVNVLANITSGNANLGNIALANYVNVSSNLTAGNANLGNLAEANYVNVLANITSGNANLGNLVLANYVNVLANITSGNANLGNLVTANFVNVSSNVTAGNANLGNLVTANYVNVSSNLTSGNANLGNLATANYINVANDVTIIGNITSGNANLGNLITANYLNLANDANIVGNITAGNADLGNTAIANSFITNGTGGDLTLTGGNISGANVINANTIEILANANVGNLIFGTGVVTGTGNITAGYYFGNGSQLTGINAAGGTANILANGNSNVNIPVANGNITFSAVGNSNVVVITDTGINVAGTANVVGNLTAGNADLGNLLTANYANISSNLAVVGNITSGNANLGNLAIANFINVSSNLTAGNANLGNLVLANFINVSSNLTAGNANLGNLVLANYVNVLANITSGNANLGNLVLANFVNVSSNLTASNANVSNLFANLANISNLEVTSNANISNLTANNAVITTGNITTINSGLMQFGNSNIAITSNANITFTSNSNATFVVTSTGANVIGNLEVSSNANVGNLSATQVFATANVTAPQLVSNVATGTSPIQVLSTTQIANMNVQTAGSLVNGTSNINIPSVNGNINFVSASNTVLVVTGTGANIAGTANVVGNAAIEGNLTVLSNIEAGNVFANSGTIGASLITGTLTTSAQPNITSLGTLGNLTVSGNLSAGNANLGNLVEANYFVGNGVNISGLTLSNSLTDVSVTGVTTGQILQFNGVNWVAATNSNPVSAGATVDFWLAPPALIANVAANNYFALDTFGGEPNTTPSTASLTITNGSTNVIVGGYSPALNRTLINPGNWSFSIWANANSVTGTANIAAAIYVVTPEAGTVTISGSGTSRTATFSTGTPFATATGSGTITDASFLKTPLGVYQISAITNDTVATILTPATYNNENAVAGSVWNQFLYTGDVALLSTVIQEYTIGSTEASRVLSLTDALGVLIFGDTTGSDKTFTISLGGTQQALHINTPFATLHDDLAGLQGGTSNQFFHLTQTEYAGTGSGIFVRDISPSLVTPNIGNATGIGLAVGVGNITAGNLNATGEVVASTLVSNVTTGTSPITVTSTTLVANLNVARANVSDYSVLTSNTTGVFYPTFVSANTAGNYVLGSNANLVFDAATGNLSATILHATGNVFGNNANLGNLVTANFANIASNITSGNANLGNLVIANYVNVSSNVTAGNANLGNLVIANYVNVSSNVTAGNANLGNLVIANYGNFASNITSGNANLGNLVTANHINVSSNITSGNANLGNLLTANYGNFANNLNVIGNANVGNLSFSTGQITGTGNVTAGYFFGNGSGLTDMLTVSQYASGTISNSVPNVNTIRFDTNTGIFVTNLGGGEALISLGSSFKTWQVAGQTSLVAVGEDTVQFVAGTGITITTNAAAYPQQIEFSSSATGISNGNSNVNIPSANGNVNISAVGVSNVLVVTGTGVNVSGTLNANGNANLGNLGASGLITATGNVSGGNLTTGGALDVSGNANVGNLGTGGLINATGNITGGNLSTSGSLSVTGNANVGNIGISGGITISGNANVGNLGVSGLAIITGNLSGGNISTSGVLTVTSNANVGNLGTAGLITATGNVSGGNLTTAGRLSVTGNANVGNVGALAGVFTGNVSVNNLSISKFVSTSLIPAANVTYNLGNSTNRWKDLWLSNATLYFDDQQTVSAGTMTSGNSNITIPIVDGNINLTANSNTTIVVTETGANITGYIYITGNANVGNLDSAGIISATGNVSGGNLSTGGSLSVTGNANIGNLGISGLLSITGNLSAGNLSTGGKLTVTGNANVGNIGAAIGVFTGNISASNATLGNLASANFISGDGYLLTNLTIPTSTTIVNGNSNVSIPVANGNINLSSAGNANIVVITGTGMNVAGTANVSGNANVGNLGASGNVAATFFIGNGSQLTGIASGANISNGNSNVNIPAANGNVNISAVGNANVVVITGTGMNVAGTANITGNIITGSGTGANISGANVINANTGNFAANVTASYFLGNGSQLTGISTSSNTIFNGNSNVSIPSANGNVNISAVGNANVVVITGTGMNVAGTANITGNIITGSGTGANISGANVINANTGNFAANVTASYFLGNGSQLTGISTSSNTIFNGNSNVSIATANGNITMSAVGNANVVVVTGTGMNVAGTANITGNIITGSGTGGNISGVNNLSANSGNFATTLNVVGNANVGNLGFGSGIITGTGNVTAGFFLGNGSQLTGISTSSNTIFNGNSNVSIPAANGNVNLSAVGNANVVVVTGTGMNVAGTANITGNIITGSGTGGNITGANVISANSGNFATTLTVTGNILGGNLTTTGQIVSNRAGNLSDGGGQLYLNGTGNNRIDFNSSGTGAPTFTTRSAGTKITLYPNEGATTVDYAIGVDSGTLWNSVPGLDAGQYFKWYGGNTQVASLSGTGVFSATGNVSGGNLTTGGALSVTGNANVGNLGFGTGQITGSGNVTAGFFIGNGSQLTGISATGSNISNGNSNVNIATANGNVTIASAGNTMITVTGTGVNVAGTLNTGSGNINTTGNVSGAYFIGNGSQLTGIATGSTSNISNGNSNVSIATANGNITMSAVGNANVVVVTGTGMNVAGTANVSGTLTVGAASGGNITGGNVISANTLQSNSYTASGAMTGNANISTVTGALGIRAISTTYTDNSAAASATIANAAIHAIDRPTLAAANATVTFTNAATLYVAAGPAAGTNATITNAYSILAAGNISAPYYFGNGSQLTGIGSAGSLSNGNSNVNIPFANGNITFSSAGNANIVVVTGTGMNVAGTANVSGTLTVGAASGGNITGGNVISANTLQSNTYTANGAVTGNANVSTITGALGVRAVFSTYTDNSAAASATIANAAIHSFAAPNLAAANTAVVFTNAATMYIAGGPVANTNATITNSYALLVGGNARFTGNIIGTVANGNSNVNIATANGNVTVAAAGNTTLTVTGTGVNVAGTLNTGSGNINTTGNVSGAFFIGNGSQLTGISGGSGSNISNGNSNVNIPFANGNINFSSAGNANIAVVTGTGLAVTVGTAATSNLTGALTVSGGGSIYGNLYVAGLVAGGAPTSVEYLVVAGGGGAASGYEAAGGGAGGVVSGSTSVPYGVYTVTVGAGGATQTNTNGLAGNSGNNSSITSSGSSIVSYGGGGGGGYQQTVTNSRGTGNGYGKDGGSGGGASRSALGGVGVYPGSAYVNAASQGYNGGDTSGSGTVAGGGGGGAVGNPPSGGIGGAGGVGVTTTIITTTQATSLAVGQVSGGSVYFGGGGGGGGDSGGGAGGLGGGGAGTSVPGTANTGGAGGGQRNDNSVTGKAGGSGAVIMRYSDTFPAAISTTGSPTITVAGGYRIYTWTSSGSITFPVPASTPSTSTSTGTLVVEGGVGVGGNLFAGNVNAGNLITANYSSAVLVTAAQPNITSVGTLTSLSVTGNINAGNLIGPHANGNSNVNIATANGNVTIASAGNTMITVTGTGVNVAGTLNTGSGNINTTGNVSGAYFIGNGSQLTGISGGGGSSISNGNSNVSIATANGNINFSATGNSNIMVITGTGANITGTANITGNVALAGANVTLGNVSNLHIAGGANGYLLTTDGSGTLSWSTPSSTVVTVDSFTGNGVQTAYTLSVTPTSVNYVFLAIGGVSQPRSTYSLAGNVVTVSSAPANTVAVEFTSITGVSGGGGGSANTSSSAIFSIPNTLSTSTTLASGVNGLSVGPITVASGVTVTVPAGQRWVVI